MEYVFAVGFTLIVVGFFVFVVWYPLPEELLDFALMVLGVFVGLFAIAVLFGFGLVIARALGIS